MTVPPEIFDRQLLRHRRARAATTLSQHDFLHRLAAETLLERLADIKLPLARLLCLGFPDGGLAQQLRADPRTQLVVTNAGCDGAAQEKHQVVMLDEEALPFAPRSFDGIVSNLSLHLTNDLPGVLRQCHDILAPQGAFLATALGGATLQELRHCLTQAELKLFGGVSPRIAPALSAESATALMQRAGFNAPVVDSERLTVVYPDMRALMHELRGMGWSNSLRARRNRMTPRSLFAEAGALYAAQFPASAHGIRATFDIIILHGWRS